MNKKGQKQIVKSIIEAGEIITVDKNGKEVTLVIDEKQETFYRVLASYFTTKARKKISPERMYEITSKAGKASAEKRWNKA